jgi:hypothetical protein
MACFKSDSWDVLTGRRKRFSTPNFALHERAVCPRLRGCVITATHVASRQVRAARLSTLPATDKRAERERDESSGRATEDPPGLRLPLG